MSAHTRSWCVVVCVCVCVCVVVLCLAPDPLVEALVRCVLQYVRSHQQEFAGNSDGGAEDLGAALALFALVNMTATPENLKGITVLGDLLSALGEMAMCSSRMIQRYCAALWRNLASYSHLHGFLAKRTDVPSIASLLRCGFACWRGVAWRGVVWCVHGGSCHQLHYCPDCANVLSAPRICKRKH
jgi:hypothetical protein